MKNKFFGYPDLKTFMKEIRIQYEKSPKEIADLLEVGDKYIYMIEKGDKTPALETFIKFATYFGFSMDAEAFEAFNETKRSERGISEKKPSKEKEPQNSEYKSTFPNSDGPLNTDNPINDESPYPNKAETTLEALQNLDPSIQEKLLEQLNQEIETVQTNQKPVITFNELKKQLLNAIKEWNQINKYKDAPMDYKEEPILTINGNYVKSEEISTEVVIEIDLNKAVFFVPKADENFIKRLVDIFSGPRYTDYLSSYPNLETDDEIAQFVVLNPTIPMLTLLSVLPEKPSSRCELSDSWMKFYLEDKQAMESFLKDSDTQ